MKTKVIRLTTKMQKAMFSLTKMSPSRILVFGFILIIMIGTWLLNLPISINPGQKANIINALFTSTSAVCITGLAVVDTSTYWSPFGKTVIIILIQIGGLGFMTVGTLISLIAKKKINLKERVLIQESLNQYDLSGVVILARNVLLLSFFIEGIGTLFLSLVFIPQFGFIDGLCYSLFHSISAFCNAGFDLLGSTTGEFSSLTSYVSNPIISLTIGALIVLGGLGFTVILDITKNRKVKKWSLHSKIVIISTIILILLGFILILLIEFNNEKTLGKLGFGGKLLASLFQSITTRTSGYNTIDLSQMHESLIFIFIIFMFIGASPASTGGGIKTTTLAILLISIRAFIIGKEDVELFGRRIDVYTLRKTICIVFIAIFTVVCGTIILSIVEPNFNLLESAFEVVSAFSTTGISIKGSYNLTLAGKILIIIYMFIGRVGSLTIFMAFTSKHNMKSSHIRYPVEKILVG